MSHQNKHIRKAIEYAIDHGWKYVEGGKSHRKGTLLCPAGQGGCRIAVYGTPRNAEDHANYLCRQVDKCHHCNDPRS